MPWTFDISKVKPFIDYLFVFFSITFQTIRKVKKNADWALLKSHHNATSSDKSPIATADPLKATNNKQTGSSLTFDLVMAYQA